MLYDICLFFVLSASKIIKHLPRVFKYNPFFSRTKNVLLFNNNILQHVLLTYMYTSLILGVYIYYGVYTDSVNLTIPPILQRILSAARSSSLTCMNIYSEYNRTNAITTGRLDRQKRTARRVNGGILPREGLGSRSHSMSEGKGRKMVAIPPPSWGACPLSPKEAEMCSRWPAALVANAVQLFADMPT